MEPKDLFTLSRSLDLTYLSNRLIIGLTITVFLASMLLQLAMGSGFHDNFVWSGRAALSLFFAWAITRELDPDTEMTSILVSSIFVLSLIYSNVAMIIPLLWTVLLLRFITRSTGLESTWVDSSLIFIIGSLLTFQYSWIYGLAMFSGFIIDLYPGKSYSRNTAFGIFSLMLTAFTIYWKSAVFTLPTFDPIVLGTLVIALLFLATIPFTRTPLSNGDHNGVPLMKSRLKGAKVVAIFIGILGITQGTEVIISQLPLWIALIGVLISNFVLMIENRGKESV